MVRIHPPARYPIEHALSVNALLGGDSASRGVVLGTLRSLAGSCFRELLGFVVHVSPSWSWMAEELSMVLRPCQEGCCSVLPLRVLQWNWREIRNAGCELSHSRTAASKAAECWQEGPAAAPSDGVAATSCGGQEKRFVPVMS